MDNLKILRIKKGLTQKQVAEIIGIKPNRLSLIESGKRGAKPEIIVKLAKVYEVTADTILKYLIGE